MTIEPTRRSFIRAASAVALATAVSPRPSSADQASATAPARRDRQALDPVAFRKAIDLGSESGIG